MKYKYDDRIFGSQKRCGDSFRTQLNNNVLVIGNSGAGKTRSYVEPNIEAAQEESLIVVDTKNDLHRKFREKLEKKGYKVFSMDLIDLCHSEYGFNPLDMIRKEKDGEYFDVDVMKFASMLVPYDMNRRNFDPFWDLSGQVFASAAIAAMLENSDEKSMRTLFEYTANIQEKSKMSYTQTQQR